MDDEIFKKIKNVIIGFTSGRYSNFSKYGSCNRYCVVKANEPKILREFGESLELTKVWARNILKGIDWLKRKGTAWKFEPCPKFLEEEKFTFQSAISKFFSDHDNPLELVLNLDQTPLSYVSTGKYTFDLKVSKTVPIKGVSDKRQITATFTVTASGSFLPIQLIYSGKTKRSILKYDLSSCFDVTFTLHSKSLVQLWKMCQIVLENYISLP